MNGVIIHALKSLLDQSFPKHLKSKVLGDAVNLFKSLIKRNRANRYRRISDDLFPGFMNIPAGTEIHYGISTVNGTEHHLLNLFGN